MHEVSSKLITRHRWALVPGMALMPSGVLAVFYFLTLGYLFFGIAIVADIFMAAIEKITSSKVKAKVVDEKGEREVMVPFWNPTIANLTLMALGSSAPEIIMATLDTVLTLGDCPGELGASCIVGSAAFNLLVISGISIYAVKKEKGQSDEPDEDGTKPGYKIIKDLGVFGITATSSVLAYVWLWIVLLDM